MAGSTVVGGIPIPSTSPIFLSAVGVHVLFGLACVVTGAVAMLSPKRHGRHPAFGTIYYWSLAGVGVTAASLALSRWSEDYALFILASLAFASATVGRAAVRRRWPDWTRLHITGMGLSYVILLTAFYVDNGKFLPVWRSLPTLAYWLLPSAVGVPLIGYTLLRHPLARRPRA